MLENERSDLLGFQDYYLQVAQISLAIRLTAPVLMSGGVLLQALSIAVVSELTVWTLDEAVHICLITTLTADLVGQSVEGNGGIQLKVIPFRPYNISQIFHFCPRYHKI